VDYRPLYVDDSLRNLRRTLVNFAFFVKTDNSAELSKAKL